MPAKTVGQLQKALSQAVSRAYDVRLPPDDIPTERAGRDVRSFISKTAGQPHTSLDVRAVAGLALSRAERMSGDEALASTVADLIDGGISLDRHAAAPRRLDPLMDRHRALRRQKNPLPADLKAKARAAAPRVIRRSGESALRAPAPAPKALVVSVGSRVKFRRLEDATEHEVFIGAPSPGKAVGIARVIPAASPLAMGLRGATVGTLLSLNIGGRPVDIEVLEVSPPGR